MELFADIGFGLFRETVGRCTVLLSLFLLLPSVSLS